MAQDQGLLGLAWQLAASTRCRSAGHGCTATKAVSSNRAGIALVGRKRVQRLPHACPSCQRRSGHRLTRRLRCAGSAWARHHAAPQDMAKGQARGRRWRARVCDTRQQRQSGLGMRMQHALRAMCPANSIANIDRPTCTCVAARNRFRGSRKGRSCAPAARPWWRVGMRTAAGRPATPGPAPHCPYS